MKLKTLGVGALTVVLATTGMGIATATAHDEYTYYDGLYYGIAYAYEYYSDPEKTEYVGNNWDSCVESYTPGIAGHAVHPTMQTPYYNESFAHHCGPMGPILLG